MPVITIPFDYRAERDSVVPICVNDTDSAGARIAWGWIKAVADVADPLRRLARGVLEDVWRVSEIAEETVHDLWRVHGEQLGREPGRQVYVNARWKALDKRAGGRRARKGFELSLLEEALENLAERHDFAMTYERREYCELIEARLRDLGLNDVSQMLRMILQDYEPHEVQRHFQLTRYAFTHRFWRGVRKAAKNL